MIYLLAHRPDRCSRCDIPDHIDRRTTFYLRSSFGDTWHSAYNPYTANHSPVRVSTFLAASLYNLDGLYTQRKRIIINPVAYLNVISSPLRRHVAHITNTSGLLSRLICCGLSHTRHLPSCLADDERTSVATFSISLAEDEDDDDADESESYKTIRC